MVLDDAGNPISKGFDLGELDVDKSTGEFLYSDRKFHLILFPKRLKMTGGFSMSHNIEGTRTAARCPFTSEYIVKFSLLPAKYGVGKFEHEGTLGIEDPQSDFADDSGITMPFRQVFFGTLSMPWVSVNESDFLNKSLNDLFFDRSSAPVEIQLHNTGNRSIELTTWESGSEDQEKHVKLVEDFCAGKSLPPGGSCQLKIARTGAVKTARPFYYSWFNTSKNENSRVRLTVEESGNGISAFTTNP